jgi:hypothetical protein
MKKTILSLCLSLSGALAIAQCDQDVTYFSGKAEFLDNAGKVERSEEGKIVFRVTKKSVTLMHNDDVHDTMKGEITSNLCDWKIPFKNGKTTFSTNLIDAGGDSKAATASIEGKDGEIVILLNIPAFGKTLKLIADRYEVEGK